MDLPPFHIQGPSLRSQLCEIYSAADSSESAVMSRIFEMFPVVKSECDVIKEMMILYLCHPRRIEEMRRTAGGYVANGTRQRTHVLFNNRCTLDNESLKEVLCAVVEAYPSLRVGFKQQHHNYIAITVSW